jgi:hypothetical protein
MIGAGIEYLLWYAVFIAGVVGVVFWLVKPRK